MAHLQYFSGAGYGEKQRVSFRYSQAVRVGDRIECAGQGGGHPETGVIDNDHNTEIDQAFANVDLAIKDAGGKGWVQVFRVNSYHVPLDNEALGAMVRNFAKWMPDHQPIWTCVGVPRLARGDMRIEIEVVAHDPEAARDSAKNNV